MRLLSDRLPNMGRCDVCQHLAVLLIVGCGDEPTLGYCAEHKPNRMPRTQTAP